MIPRPTGSSQTASRSRAAWCGVRRGRTRRAFTLIEMLAVVVIVGILMGLGFRNLRVVLDGAKERKAISDLKAMAAALNALEELPASLSEIGWGGRLDPWGRPYVYAPFPEPKGKGKGKGKSNAPPKGARKDRFLIPINSRFDLYSLGADGRSVAPLTANASRDDIVVGNDGGFVGRASLF